MTDRDLEKNTSDPVIRAATEEGGGLMARVLEREEITDLEDEMSSYTAFTTAISGGSAGTALGFLADTASLPPWALSVLEHLLEALQVIDFGIDLTVGLVLQEPSLPPFVQLEDAAHRGS